MKEKAFLDSNIWLYAFLKQNDKKRELAKELIESLDNKVIISTQVINEVSVNLVKNDFSETVIKEIVFSFFNDYDVIDFNIEILINASNLRNNKISFWDSLIVASALKKNCSILYTEDMHHDQIIHKKLKIINPFK